jgi:hypothetical protein
LPGSCLFVFAMPKYDPGSACFKVARAFKLAPGH